MIKRINEYYPMKYHWLGNTINSIGTLKYDETLSEENMYNIYANYNLYNKEAAEIFTLVLARTGKGLSKLKTEIQNAYRDYCRKAEAAIGNGEGLRLAHCGLWGLLSVKVVLLLEEPGGVLPAAETARQHADQRVLEGLPEVPVEVGVDDRVQGGIEVTDPE
ncbi:hypothetical protein QE152_g8582 [Popillia japonica]|uniref:Uncharacterized protein n=1 Tax=Popillia japonica TaxID=7064 RepID=A0AAW1LXI3_POPJA